MMKMLHGDTGKLNISLNAWALDKAVMYGIYFLDMLKMAIDISFCFDCGLSLLNNEGQHNIIEQIGL